MTAELARIRAADLLVVWVGGTVGTALRVALTPERTPTGFPVTTFLVNLVGAGLLGLLVARLSRREETVRTRRLRLLLGAGVLGGFTTYSALAVDTVLLVRDGAVARGLAYAVSTLLLGGAATWLGLHLGRRTRRP